MSVETESSAPRARTATTAGLARLRRGSLAVLVPLVVEYAIGMYVNLYVTVPGAGHGGSLGSAISNGPASLSVHAVIGLGALGVAAQSILVRHWGLIAASVIGLLAMIFASVAGTGFTSTGADSASMAMSVLTGIAMLCYAANLCLLRPGIRRG